MSVCKICGYDGDMPFHTCIKTKDHVDTLMMKTILPITADFEIELPQLPNFIRQPNGITIDVKDIHSSSLAIIADKWKEALLAHAEVRRRNAT